MKKTWRKPELLEEDFNLTQHVAIGCETDNYIEVIPGGTVPAEIGCADTYSGEGHKHYHYEIKDINNNGKIDWDEVVAATNEVLSKEGEGSLAADNGVVTGHGHLMNHGAAIKVYEYVWGTTELPFTS